MTPSYEDSIRDFLFAARRCEVVNLEHLREAVRLVGHIRALVHALQLERGASSVHLGVGAGDAAFLARYQRAADTAVQGLREELSRWLEEDASNHARSRLLGRMALALHGLAGLSALRRHVGGGGVSPMEATHAYSDVIRALLAVAFEAADSATDPDISRALVALLNFMQGKELAGQERAIGVGGFGAGGFDSELRQALVHRIDAQERCFRIFSDFACDTACLAWRTLQADGCAIEVERLRRRACTQKAWEAAEGAALAHAWFAACTARIDALKGIEDLLETHLNARCMARIEADRADLGETSERIARLTEAELRDVVPYAVFFGAGVADAGEDSPARPLGMPLVCHSVMDLVQRQAARLQSMEDELRAARDALSERKTIERAKALLIERRGLSEDQAYKLLRQTAMDQNRRLVEVAEAALAMSALLGGARVD